MQNIVKIKSQIFIILLVFLSVIDLYARENIEGNKKKKETPTPAAGCAPAVAITILELNNVSARIDGTGGSMWQNRANGISAYEVPKRINIDDPRYTSIFAGALWMGGKDVTGQLKIAAVTFRGSGKNDFWPGPLNVTTAEVDDVTCNKYDRFFNISRIMVNQFVAWYQAGIDDDLNGTTTQQDDFPEYVIPKEILEYPAHGDVSLGQDWHLAPFFDVDGDDFYDPEGAGDYPKYDLLGDIDCRTTRDIRLFGDETIWWVFNDKGNIHSHTNGPSIGMEIRAQAFAFATNDEVNDMTFYNYEMINRSTFTLTNTYFGQWVDADLGGAADDFVGCDASRGLGYCYNGDDFDDDAGSQNGYGSQPPAVGVDFFEGPFADNDTIDNPLTTIVQDALDSNGIPYPGLGIGYGDGIVDNERYGMRKFVYYNNGGAAAQSDPSTALDYYNYLQGVWKDQSKMTWGGNARNTGVPADLMFPDDSDTLFWSTKGIAPSPAIWSEITEDNSVGDRRFLESAGPFTLEPGAVNDLTVGVVWARAQSGGAFASVEQLKVADDKAQALFDNCFKVVEGPDAPDLTFQELDKELILYLTNSQFSNNYQESYSLKNPFIAIPDILDGVFYPTEASKDSLKIYKFQGYQVFQVKHAAVSVNEVYNVDVSRLAIQVDIVDRVDQLINYTFDKNLQANIPLEMVNGLDTGIRHSFRIKNDLFATGDPRLVNHKTYYFIAIAYGYNEYKHYNQLDPLALDGQTKPYISSRKMASGSGITSFSAIPHNPTPEKGGTMAHSSYGDGPEITRVEGQGNGGLSLDLTESTEAFIVSEFSMDFPVYAENSGPIKVQVIDPLNVVGGSYRVTMVDTVTVGNLNDAYWTLTAPGSTPVISDQTIEIENEQIFLDYGISISIQQVDEPGVISERRPKGNGKLKALMEFEDSSKTWLTGLRDQDIAAQTNWIRSGTANFGVGSDSEYSDYSFDNEQDFEGLLDGTWSPYRMVSRASFTGSPIRHAPGFGRDAGGSQSSAKLQNLQSVDIVITSDRSKWSRCVVLETRNEEPLSEGVAEHLDLRDSPSVDKDGNDDGSGTKGLGWFPGYAINLETGERLNIGFGEDSWLGVENGRDMKWNPTATVTAGINNEIRWGGKHFVYVFGTSASFPAYDGCWKIHDELKDRKPYGGMRKAFGTCMWVGIPLLNEGHDLLETDVKIKLRVEKPYANFTTSSVVNGGLPMYDFSLDNLATEFGNSLAADSALAMLNVVPNPYYGFSAYETGQLDKRVKLTNLPEECVISIYNISGTLIRKFNKSDPTTSLDWDLENHAKIPIAGGVYLIHVEVPGVGERTLKWFGAMKPTDLNGF